MNQSSTMATDKKHPLLISLLLLGLLTIGLLVQASSVRAGSGTLLYLPVVMHEFPPIPKLSSEQATIDANKGECTTLNWQFVDADSVAINRAKGFSKRDMPVTGSMEVCPSVTTTYEATARYADGSEITLQTIIDVTGDKCNRDPWIFSFKPTASQVNRNEKVTVTWDVRCNSETYLQLNADPEHHVEDFFQNEYKMEVSTFFKLRVTKELNGGTIFEERASFGVTVRPGTREDLEIIVPIDLEN